MNDVPAIPAADPWQTRSVRIAEIKTEIDGVLTYRLIFTTDTEHSGSYRFVPGQFNMLYLPGVGESAISMSGNPAECRGWVHTVRVAGAVTRTLAQLDCGQTLGVRGPFGQGWPLEELTQRDVVIVAGGLGLAPLRPLIYDILDQRQKYGRVQLIIGARSPETLLYREEYQVWQAGGIDMQVTVDRATSDWLGQIGPVTLPLERLRLTDPAQTRLVTCGPEVMMKFVAASAERRGVAADRIWVSLERNMQCAVGLCGHCQLGPAFLCKDGPVLRYDRVRRDLFVEQL